MIRKTLAIAGLLLVIFHGRLFVGQAWDGQLVDLALAARWLVAAGLVFGLRKLQQQGASIFFGRKAVALWVLAALLHGPALVDRLRSDAPAVPEMVASVLQTGAGAVAAGLLLFLAFGFGVRRRTNRSIARAIVVDAVSCGPLSLHSHSLFAPRPPPIVQM